MLGLVSVMVSVRVRMGVRVNVRVRVSSYSRLLLTINGQRDVYNGLLLTCKKYVCINRVFVALMEISITLLF